MARTIFSERLPVLEHIATGRIIVPITEKCPCCGHEPTVGEERARELAIERAVRPGDQVRAMEVLGRIGMGTSVSIDDVKARLIAQVGEMREWAKEQGLTHEQAESLLRRLDPVWGS